MDAGKKLHRDVKKQAQTNLHLQLSANNKALIVSDGAAVYCTLHWHIQWHLICLFSLLKKWSYIANILDGNQEFGRLLFVFNFFLA